MLSRAFTAVMVALTDAAADETPGTAAAGAESAAAPVSAVASTHTRRAMCVGGGARGLLCKLLPNCTQSLTNPGRLTFAS